MVNYLFPLSRFTVPFIRSGVRLYVEVVRDNNIEEIGTICARSFDCRSFENALIYYNNQVLHFSSSNFAYIVRMSLLVSGSFNRVVLMENDV